MKHITLILLLRIYPFLLLSLTTQTTNAQQQQDPTTLNGGSILAMAGKNCIAIAVDKRFGSGPQTINVSPRTMLIPHPRLMVGFTGLEGDVQSLASELSTLVTLKKERNLGFGFRESGEGAGSISSISKRDERNNITPESMSMLLSHVLYSRRRSPYYVEPIVAGLEKRIKRRKISSSFIDSCDNNNDNNNDGMERKDDYDDSSQEAIMHNDNDEMECEYVPFLCAQDVIGAQSKSKSFVCSGAASKSLYGIAEAMWIPDLSPDELIQVCGRAFLSALERDCLSGYGAMVYLIVGGQGITEIDLACRSD